MINRIFIPYVFSMQIRKFFSYRVDFWIQFLGGAIVQFTIAWFLWRSIFDYTGAEKIGAYTFRSMMLYYLLVPIVGRSVRGSEMGGMAEEIYQGTLNRYLVYPLSFLAYRFSIQFAHTIVFLFQGVIILAVFLIFFNHGEISPRPTDILIAISATITASFLHFIIISSIELTAFWADNVWSLVIIVRFITGLLGGGMLPLSLFPDWLSPILLHLPFAYFINFPIQCLMGTVSITQWLTGLTAIACWSVLFTGIYAIVWNRGKHQYTGVGI